MTDQLTQLSNRLRALEDERDIGDTIDRYAHAIDYGEDGEWVDCFTTDGTIEVRAAASRALGDRHGTSSPGRMGRHAGRQALQAFIAAQSRPPERWHKHVVSQTRVVLEGDAATAVSYLIRIDESGDVLRLYSMGRYRDRLIRSTDGRWRIAERIVEMESVSPTPA